MVIGIGLGIPYNVFAGGGGGGGAPFIPAGAIADINVADLGGSNAKALPSTFTTSFSGNMITQSSGDIIKSSNTTAAVTEFFANGPQGIQTAMRANCTSGQVYYFARGLTWPAINAVFRVKAKLNAGADIAVRFGVFTGATESSYQVTLNATTWTTLETTVTTNGAQQPWLGIQANVGAADILIDEVQLYLSGETIPDFADEILNAPVLKNYVGLTDTVAVSGGALVSGTPFMGVIPLPSNPLRDTFTELTMLIVTKTTSTAGFGRVLGFDDGLGAYIAVSDGQISGAPALSYLDRNKSELITNLDYNVYSIRVKANEQDLWVDKFKHHSATNAATGLPSTSVLQVGSNTVGTQYYEGFISNIAVYDSFLNDADMRTAVDALRARHTAAGLSGTALTDAWIAEGDSISFENAGPANGPSFQAQYFQSTRTGIVGQNNAVPGSSLTTLEARKAALIDRVAVSVAGGVNVIVSVLVGANGLPTIAALESYWSDLQAAGAKVVACTILPRDDGIINNTARKALNVEILASTVPDAVADFGGSATVGADGAPTTGTYYYDLVHPNAAGHAILESIITPVVESLR